MGFTLAAALEAIGPAAKVVVAELVPEVVTWNRTLIGAPAGNPLADKRSHVYVGDVADVIRREPAGFDAILMDVDNGPEALVRRENDWLYNAAGLRATRAALRSRGVLAIGSSSPDRAFGKRLRQAGFDVREHVVRPHRAGKGPRHPIWIGTWKKGCQTRPFATSALYSSSISAISRMSLSNVSGSKGPKLNRIISM